MLCNIHTVSKENKPNILHIFANRDLEPSQRTLIGDTAYKYFSEIVQVNMQVTKNVCKQYSKWPPQQKDSVLLHACVLSINGHAFMLLN